MRVIAVGVVPVAGGVGGGAGRGGVRAAGLLLAHLAQHRRAATRVAHQHARHRPASGHSVTCLITTVTEALEFALNNIFLTTKNACLFNLVSIKNKKATPWIIKNKIVKHINFNLKKSYPEYLIVQSYICIIFTYHLMHF